MAKSKLSEGYFVYGKLEKEKEVLDYLKNKVSKQAIKERLEDSIRRGAELVRDEAVARAPIGTRPPRRGVRTGRLKQSIRVFSKAETEEEYKKTGYISVWTDYPEGAERRGKRGYKEYYAFAPEYGTKKMSARPDSKYGFLRSAARKKRRQVMKLIREEMLKFAGEIEKKINGG